VAIDRAATLKNAEKLLRQGKIEPAIAEYLRLAEDQPRDWNIANTLGDLYVRARQVDKAVEQFTRIADSLSEEGFLPKASAIYKKILKLRPEHEHALVQAAEIAGSLGLLADARTYLTQIISRRLGRGDKRGAAQARIRLGSLDPADFESRMVAASARVEIGDVAGAARDLKEIAAELLNKGRSADAIETLREAAGLTPDDDEIRRRLLDVYVATGDFARARECTSTPEQLKALAETLEAGGHVDAALDTLAEAARLDSEDGELRARLARAFAARGDVARAREYAATPDQLKELAVELEAGGHQAAALEALSEAARLDPADSELRARLARALVASGDLTRAREYASTPDQLKELAGEFQAGGHHDAALEALSEAARLDPADTELRAHLARTLVARGDLDAAAQYLTVETAGDDPHLLFRVAEIKLRGEVPDDGLAIVRSLLRQHPDRREDVALLGWTIAEQTPELGFSVVEAAADTAVAGQDWASAAAALQEFVTRVPNHIPALMRLVEICVDGGLEATMYSAQAHLADAYIAGGQAAEARFIAEDLVAREPWDRSNLERFRRALVLLGEPDPEALIAERLSGQSPFMTTDLFLESNELPAGGSKATDLRLPGATPPATPPAAPPAAPGIPETHVEASAADPKSAPKRPAKPGAKHPDRDHFQISKHTIDLESILGELESPPAGTPAVAHASTESVEVDLSIVLDDIKQPQRRPETLDDAPAPPADLDGVFAHLRDDASRRSAMDVAEQQYKRALALREVGDVDNCIAALEAASVAPRLRFVTASLLGRIFRDRGMNRQAVEWLEKAAQAPAPTADEGHDLLYDLADALEKEGEVARALAICLELQADADGYRDVAARIDRLTKVQARG
jgi:tetratricopeptide (TPR) repeat protein